MQFGSLRDVLPVFLYHSLGTGLFLAPLRRPCRRGALKGAARVPTHESERQRGRDAGKRDGAGGGTEDGNGGWGGNKRKAQNTMLRKER